MVVLNLKMTRVERFWLLGLVAGSWALYLVHLTTVRDSPLFNYLFIDPLLFDEWARRIAAGQWMSDAPFFLDPLYHYFVALIYKVAGPSYTAVAAVQGLLLALVPGLLFVAARPWLGTYVARAAGLVAALYLPSVYYSALLMKPGLTLVLVSVALALGSRALIRASVVNWAATGAAFGLAGLTRGTLLPVIPLLALWLLIGSDEEENVPLVEAVRRRLGDAARWARVASLLAGTALVLALPAAHNRSVSGEWILSAANWGQIVFIGNNPTNPTGLFQQLQFVSAKPEFEQRDFKAEAERRSGRPLSHRRVSAFWLGEATRWMREQPLDWAGLSWSKLRIYWGAYETPDSIDFYLYREYAPMLRLPLPGFGLIAPLGLLGAVLAWKRKGWPRMLLVFAATYSTVALLFFIFTRFRMVAMPALFVFAGFALVETPRRVKAAREAASYKPVAIAAAFFVAFFGFVNLPVRGPADSRSVRLATAVGLPTQVETSWNAHYNLGLAYAGMAKDADNSAGLLELAARELRESQRQNPDLVTLVELGKVLARQERNDEAIAVYLEAASREPASYSLQHALGLLHRRTGDLAAAASYFERAVVLAPNRASSATLLGEVLLELDRPAEAAAAFQHALQVRPGDDRATQGLSQAAGRLRSGASR